MKKADIIAGGFLMFFAVLVMFEAGTYANKGVQIEYYGPAFFPFILCAALLVTSAIMIFFAATGRALRRAETIDWHGFGRVVIALAAGIVYWLAIDHTGFLMGTPVFLFVLMSALGARSWPKRLIVAMVAPTVVWAIFEYFLVISLPESSILYMLRGEG